MGEVQRGQLILTLEPTANKGRQVIVSEQAIGTLSATNQPSSFSSTGHMHLHIIVRGATATGTVTIAGLKSDGTTAVTETTPTLPAATTQQPFSEYCTSATYNVLNSGGLTVSGLTNATVTVYGILQGTKLVPVTFDESESFDYYSPTDHRGIMYKDIRVTQMNKHVSLDKFDSALYPDTSTWIGYTSLNPSPTVTTIPATPTVLKAATAVSGTPLSLTTQPKAPGQVLQLIVASSAAAGTVAITGTNAIGQTITETITCPGDGTFYTTNAFATVSASGIVITTLTSATLAVNGIFATKFVFKMPASSALQTAALGLFSGTDTSVFPFAYVEEIDIAQDDLKELKLTAKWTAQDKVILGNRATTSLTTNRLPTLGQPYDSPVVGWPGLIYIDAMSGTTGTTQYNDLLSATVKIMTGLTPTYTTTNSQVYNRIYQDGTKVTASLDGVIDFTDAVQYELFRQNVKQQLTVKFRGPFVGNDAGSLTYKTWQFDMPMKFTLFNEDRSAGDKVTAKITGIAEYDPVLAYAIQMTVINQANPNYATT